MVVPAAEDGMISPRAALRNAPGWLIAALMVFLFCWLPLPPWLGLGLLLTATFWLGPLVVYATQRRPTSPPVERFAPEQLPTLPVSHQQRFATALPELRSLGFLPVGWVALVQPQQRLRGTKLLLQHPETSDIAHVMISGPPDATAAAAAVSLGFRRQRASGGWLSTGCSTLPSPRRRRDVDDGLWMRGERRIADLWMLHGARVAADPLASRNPPTADALADENGLNAAEAIHCVASGYWREAAVGMLRPTLRGALAMSLRMLPPWKQLADLRAWQRCRRLRRQGAPPPARASRRR
jgi:hypothetical protein